LKAPEEEKNKDESYDDDDNSEKNEVSVVGQGISGS